MAEQADVDKLAQGLAALAASLQANQPRRKVEFGEYYERRQAGRPVLTRDCYQGGRAIDPDVLSPEEVTLLNRITRSGFYVDKLVNVTLREEGGGRQTVHIQYNNASNDQRNGMLRRTPEFSVLLEKIVAAQDAENQEEDLIKQERKAIREGGTFGNNKAYREAKAVADARATNG